MALAVLALNDQSLLLQAAGGPLLAEPGFAHVGPRGIETGEGARAVALREPQHSYHRYWSQLGETELPKKTPWARHHADIAFAQLRHLWHRAATPESLILLPPGSLTDAQLALLLGMIEALPARTMAVIDHALATCLSVDAPTLLVELQLHQSVLTVCRPRGAELQITDQEVVAELGLMQLLNAAARHISDELIRSHRHDPLDAPESEQELFDRLPVWLARLGWEAEFSARLRSGREEFSFILRREAVARLVDERLATVRSFMARHSDCPTLLSHDAALLAGLSATFSKARVAPRGVAVANCLHREWSLGEQEEGLHRLRSLQRADGHGDAGKVANSVATHLLYRHRAVALDMPVSVRVDGGEVELSHAIDPSAALTVVIRNGVLEALHSAPGVDLELPSSCRPGQVLAVGGNELRLIEVQDAP